MLLICQTNSVRYQRNGRCTGTSQLAAQVHASMSLKHSAMHAGSTHGQLAGTEFDNIELHQSVPHHSRLHQKSAVPGSAPEDRSQAGHAAPDAGRLHTVLDIDEDTAHTHRDHGGNSGPPGLSNKDVPERISRESVTDSVANREKSDEGDEDEEVRSESSGGQPDDAPDEESFLAQLQRLDHEGKLRDLSGDHALVSSLPSFGIASSPSAGQLDLQLAFKQMPCGVGTPSALPNIVDTFEHAARKACNELFFGNALCMTFSCVGRSMSVRRLHGSALLLLGDVDTVHTYTSHPL